MTGPARFITLEGGEGGGKTTLARRLSAALAAAGLPGAAHPANRAARPAPRPCAA